ncbi:alpha/beta hydrolase [Flaviaesturariibacter amylovorans]|uniref:Alpha/beta hydrolase family protein n=1 Tax=Flaviaesturariibacter amylovorans TaxID=1084520 RepID=A0ABP8GHW2_9BACT
MKRILLLATLLSSLYARSADVDTVSIASAAMGRSLKCVVIRPDAYARGTDSFATVYLLHGLTGRYDNWVQKARSLKEYVDRYNVVVVCPDGAFNSWYLDSPEDPKHRFETYIAQEVPAFIESRYRVRRARGQRAITGLSMGGHGGLYLGLRHSRFFGAAGGMSGAYAIENITEKQYGVSRLLGDTASKARYRAHSIFGELEKPRTDTLALILDCGVDDFIVDMSRAAHKRLLELKIAHDYTERPGKHDWPYWNNAVQYQLLFFRNYFDRNASR